MSMRHWTALLTLVPLALATCGDEAGGSAATRTSEPGEPPAIEEVYVGLAATLQRDGLVLHSTQTMEAEVAGFMKSNATIEYWVDGPGARARLELNGSYESVEQGETHDASIQVIYRDGESYQTEQGTGEGDPPDVHDAPGCHGQLEAIALVIGCPGPTETSSTTVEWGEHDGERALVLVTEGTSRGADEVSEFIERAYLDPETFLPIYSHMEGTYSTGTSYPQTAQSAYEHEFIERSSLPADFFDFSALGYVEPDLLALFDEHFVTPVYWLGEEFEPGGDLPTVVLSNVSDGVVLAPEIATYDGALSYAPADHPHGPGAFGMQLWPADEWDAVGGPALASGAGSGPCVTGESVPIDGGEATLYRWIEGEHGAPTFPTPGPTPTPRTTMDPACAESGYRDRFMAVVRFPETVLLIDAPTGPYNSAEGMRAIIEGLERR